MRSLLWIFIVTIIISGCNIQSYTYTKKDIVRITDFELSPDEEMIAFSAITPLGNLDIWVVDIEGKNPKKLTFQDSSLTNHIARYFKKRHWRNFYEIDMTSPSWTVDGRILYCQELTKNSMWSSAVVNRIFWTINPDGSDKRQKTDKEQKARKEPPGLINTFKVSDVSDKHKKGIFLKHGALWYMNQGESIPKRLIQ